MAGFPEKRPKERETLRLTQERCPRCGNTLFRKIREKLCPYDGKVCESIETDEKICVECHYKYNPFDKLRFMVNYGC